MSARGTKRLLGVFSLSPGFSAGGLARFPGFLPGVLREMQRPEGPVAGEKNSFPFLSSVFLVSFVAESKKVIGQAVESADIYKSIFPIH